MLLLAACGNAGEPAQTSAPPSSLAPADWADAAVLFISPQGAPNGAAMFKDTPHGVLMRIELTGLTPGWHGVHLHQAGDCSDGAAGFKASGGHIDPEDNAHGLLNPAGPEAADMANVFAGADGRAVAEIFNSAVFFKPRADNTKPGLADADGFAIIVHENADDHMTQPIGGAGARVACTAVRGV